MQVVRLEVNECMPGANTYPKILLETPIGETPAGMGETPCNETVDYEIYPQLTFQFFDQCPQALMDKVAPFLYTEILHPNACGAQVEMYVSPTAKKLIDWEVEKRTQELQYSIHLSHREYNSKCVEVAQHKQTLNQMKWWLCGMSGLTVTTVVALGYVVTELLSK